jgi:hypothetical protein
MRFKNWLTLTVLVFVIGNARADTPVTLGGMKSSPPSDWKAEVTSSPMRAYQFAVPKSEGDPRDAEIIIFNFGTMSGGTPEQNIARWKGMFIPPEGKKIDDVAKVEEFKVGTAEITYLDVQGTYRHKTSPMAATEDLRPDSRMIAVMFQIEQGTYYIRFVGPAKTVTAHKQQFDDWLKAFK